MKIDTRTEFLLNLYKEFGSEAQGALDFLKNNGAYGDNTKTVTEPESTAHKVGVVDDGIYIVYNDGTYVPADDDTPTENARFVGISQEGHTFGVGRLIGEYRLLTADSAPEDEYCIKEEYKGLVDWEFVAATEHIKELGTPIPFNDGEYLPTMPMFVIMANLADKGLNKALTHIGLDKIDLSKDYWFARRYGISYAWIFGGSYGNLGSSYVGSRSRCQAVTLWDPQ